MPWFRVDDNLAFHHKVVAAGNAAMGLWVRAGSLCAQQLTDGFVPAHMVTTLGTRAQARRLVEVGLWTTSDGGYEFHEWADRQPSRERVEADRHAATERQRRARDKAKSRHDHSSPSAASRCDDSVSHDRPDPAHTPPKSSPGQSPPRPPGHGLTDEDLAKIQLRLRCDRRHAVRVVESILSKAAGEVRAPVQFVRAAIEAEPGRYRPTSSGPNPRLGDVICPVNGHSDHAGSCRQCASEAKAVPEEMV